MFGLGLSEILLILGLGLIFIGPERLPDLARSLARGFAEFRRSFEEVKSTIEKDIRTVDTENLLRQGKPFPLQDVGKALLEGGEKFVPPQALVFPEPREEAPPPPEPSAGAAPQQAAAPAAPPPATDFRSDFRAGLKAELKAELLEELRRELRSERQAEGGRE